VGHRVYDRWEFEHKNKPFEVQVRGSLIMNDANLALDAAEGGAGLVYSDEDMIADRIKARRLEIVLGDYASASTGCYLYYPQRSQVPPKLRAFIEHVKKIRNL
jgi:DNA-binding transcriptional LysR family regulator